MLSVKAVFAGGPLPLAWWAGNRLLANLGLLVVWKRIRSAPDRLRRFFLWLILVNVVSLGAFFCLLPLFRRH